jgi:type III pantothenate kinase
MNSLLLDIGNSRLKWGVFDKGAIRRTGHIRQSTIRERGLAALASRLPRKIDAAFACNVAGATLAVELARLLKSHCNCEVKYARSEAQACGVTNGYRQPGRLGVDRWVAMIAARAACDTSSIVVDAGTAITIDALDDDGQHLGGQILPGIASMTESLDTNTSDIPRIRRRIPGRAMGIFGGTTATAVSQGVIGAAVGAVERAVRVLREEGYDPTVFLTGGDAPCLLEALVEEPVHSPHLVLEGLARILESRGEVFI